MPRDSRTKNLLKKTSHWNTYARILMGLILLGALSTTACETLPTPTPRRLVTALIPPTESPFPTQAAPTLTPTITPTMFPLALFPGFVNTSCAWGMPAAQLLDCLSKFTGIPMRLTDGPQVASQEMLKAADGSFYEVNVLSQAGRTLRNIQGTTYWDFSSLTPTPTVTWTPPATPTPTTVPQAMVGSLRFYEFDSAEIKYMTEALQWVKSVDIDVWTWVTNVNVAIYRVEPDFLSSIGAISGFSPSTTMPDMFTPFAADRINVRSDYMRALVSDTKGSTHESNQLGFVAFLAQHLQLVRDYRAYLASGRALSSCENILPAQEYKFLSAGFQARLDVIQKISQGALAKGLVAAQEFRKDETIKRFKADTDQWIKDYTVAVQRPELVAARCYPPTPTPVPTPAPNTPTPTLAPGMGALVVFNPYADATFTIYGPAYRIPSQSQVVITLPQGRYSYTASFAGFPSVTGSVSVEAGKFTRFDLPQPKPLERPTGSP